MTVNLDKKGLRWFTPFVTGLDLLGRPFLPARPHILIPCMMKSGSTFLAHALASHSGLRRVRLTPAWGSREQELSELRLSRYNHFSYVSQHHIKNSEWTQALIRRYRMNTVVLVRDLFDIVVSLRDHIRRESPVMPVATFTAQHGALSDDALEQAIVDLAIPWFINFYVGWSRAPGVLHMNYEDMIADPAEALTQILSHAGVTHSPASIDKALAEVRGKETRINKGVAGRGTALKPALRQRIVDMLSHYPDIMNDAYVQRMLQRNMA